MNPQKSLEVRWNAMIAARPDFESSYGFVPMVIDTGWAVVAVPEDDVSYTVGLHYRFGQKELLISAPHLGLHEQKAFLNELAKRVIQGARFDAGDKLELEGQQLTFKTYEDSTFSKYPCGYLARFEQFFEDRAHVAGGTLPVLWAVLKPSRAASKQTKVHPPTRASKSVSREKVSRAERA
ncbi:MAG: DUF4262 domain-containing protein [Archangium sp.]